MFALAATVMSNSRCILLSAVRDSQFAWATSHLTNTPLHNLSKSLPPCVPYCRRLQEVRGVSEKRVFGSCKIIEKHQVFCTVLVSFGKDCWGHTQSGHQDLPCPVRLKLPPSQSASELQLCLPGSCNRREIRVSVCTQLGMWRKVFILDKARWKLSGTFLIFCSTQKLLFMVNH